ncbi:MAG: hypothetical protein HY423_09445 [Candidatus Lambdaproteobacteria bacterium]|nr:hypothetical protein [Candidatus Lambdaproteobacteria bacterium]
MTFPSPTDPFTLFLAGAVVVGRGLDFLSTWVVTPRLELEANPLARRLRWWPMALLNAPLVALPFVHHGLAIVLVVASLLAAGGNLSAGALAKGMGERAHLESQLRALRRLGLGKALLMNTAGALVVCLAGAFMLFLVPVADSPAGWAAGGVSLYGASGLVHLNWAIVRLHGRLRRRAHRRG